MALRLVDALYPSEDLLPDDDESLYPSDGYYVFDLDPPGQRWRQRMEPHAVDPGSTAALDALAAGEDATLAWVDQVASEHTDGTAGYARLLNIDDEAASPDAGLAWVSMIAGIDPTGQSAAALRSQIRVPTGIRRGTLDALREAVARTTLDGTLTILERTTPFETGDHEDDLLLLTHLSVTPDVRATLNALRSQNGGLNRLWYRVLTAPTWDELATHTWEWLEARTWDDLAGTEPAMTATWDQMALATWDELESTIDWDQQNYVVALSDQTGA